MSGRNEVTLTAEIVQREVLRFTPAGIAVLDARVAHNSVLTEAGMPRQVSFEMAVLFAGRLAEKAAVLPLGQSVRLSGFLAARRRLSKALVLHVTALQVELDDPVEPTESTF